MIGGLSTTYWSWRIVFVGEVVMVAGIVVFSSGGWLPSQPSQASSSTSSEPSWSALGLGLVVFAVLLVGHLGRLPSEARRAQWLGMSLVLWLLLAPAQGCSSDSLPGRTTGS